MLEFLGFLNCKTDEAESKYYECVGNPEIFIFIGISEVCED